MQGESQHYIAVLLSDVEGQRAPCIGSRLARFIVAHHWILFLWFNELLNQIQKCGCKKAPLCGGGGG